MTTDHSQVKRTKTLTHHSCNYLFIFLVLRFVLKKIFLKFLFTKKYIYLSPKLHIFIWWQLMNVQNLNSVIFKVFWRFWAYNSLLQFLKKMVKQSLLVMLSPNFCNISYPESQFFKANNLYLPSLSEFIQCSVRWQKT